MSRTHDELREALGAFVLGQLDDGDGLRTEVEQHVATCDSCRAEVAELAPLARGLRGVDPVTLRPLVEQPPAELDARIRAMFPPSPAPALLAERRSRKWALAVTGGLVGAAAATVAALVLTNGADEAPAGPTVVAVPGVESSDGVTATAGYVDHTWGIEIKLEARGLTAGRSYEMQVTAADGKVYDAGAFLGIRDPDKMIVCDMSTSLLRADAVRFDVVDRSGAVVISGDLES